MPRITKQAATVTPATRASRKADTDWSDFGYKHRKPLMSSVVKGSQPNKTPLIWREPTARIRAAIYRTQVRQLEVAVSTRNPAPNTRNQVTEVIASDPQVCAKT